MSDISELFVALQARYLAMVGQSCIKYSAGFRMFHTHAGEVSWSWNSCSIGVEEVEGPQVHIFGKQQYGFGPENVGLIFPMK